MNPVTLSGKEIDPSTVVAVHPYQEGSLVVTAAGNQVISEPPDVAREALGFAGAASASQEEPAAEEPAPAPPAKKAARQKPEPPPAPARHR